MTFSVFNSPRPDIPTWYILFFLYIEPLSTIIGAYYAYLRQHEYLFLTHAATSPLSPSSIPLGTSIVLSQLANLYFCFTLNEALVLRCTNDLKVWKTFVFCLLIADFGHLYSVAPVGHYVYWKFWVWNAIDWGNVGFVYVGALTRITLLCGVGFDGDQSAVKELGRKKR
ncbi:hypothetical protein GQ43DRAFT_440257 [Delitschia confertaspora ATCC 74209]|uniref:DUF7704 domain-containing protein n=1 Tax=Delitschia confertaspora ATCC 74209 TaxID=1513339 RepID=A0A9P4MSU9_9PLEO|nr:hypothetical protein GQ43DRAFT_440257 [Delitschia confertaspora ATCC 74209]